MTSSNWSRRCCWSFDGAKTGGRASRRTGWTVELVVVMMRIVRGRRRRCELSTLAQLQREMARRVPTKESVEEGCRILIYRVSTRYTCPPPLTYARCIRPPLIRPHCLGSCNGEGREEARREGFCRGGRPAQQQQQQQKGAPGMDVSWMGALWKRDRSGMYCMQPS